MKKNLLRISLLIVAVILSSKAFIALTGYQFVESLRQVHGDKFSVNYSWVYSGFDGSLRFEDVEITPYSLKRSFSIPELHIQYGSYHGLLTHLLDLKELSLQGMERVIFKDFSGQLEGRDPEEWLANEYRSEWLIPFGLYACGDQSRVNHGSLGDMGIDSISGDMTIEFGKDVTNTKPSVSVGLEFDNLGRAGIELTVGAWPEEGGLESLPIHEMNLVYADNGYMRRLTNYCESVVGLDRQKYAEQAALAWRQAMAQNGLLVSDSLVNAYFTYLGLGGAIEFSLRPSVPLLLGELLTEYDENVLQKANASIRVNDASIQDASIILAQSYFDPQVEEPVSEPEPQTEQATEPRVVEVPIDELDSLLGAWVDVSLITGKQYQGVLKAIDEFNIELVPEDSENGLGQVSYSLKREEIATIQARLPK